MRPVYTGARVVMLHQSSEDGAAEVFITHTRLPSGPVAAGAAAAGVLPAVSVRVDTKFDAAAIASGCSRLVVRAPVTKTALPK